MLCAQYFGFHENLYIQHQRGGFPRELYDGWSLDLQKNLHQDGFLAYWAEQGEEYTSSFQEHVARLASMPVRTYSADASHAAGPRSRRAATYGATH
jgi:hypothetical protein